jgi:hypothetical protein
VLDDVDGIRVIALTANHDVGPFAAVQQITPCPAFQPVGSAVAGDDVGARSTDRILDHDVVGDGDVLCQAANARKVVVSSVLQVNCQVDGLVV